MITAQNHGIIKIMESRKVWETTQGKVCMKVYLQLWGGKTNLSSEKVSVKHVGLGGFR